VKNMAKTYLNTIKYEIKAKYEVDGIVDKPDIVGAIFGQSEGLLGEDMDLKELQQAGKLGRIEITVNKSKGKTYGEITIPSSLDQIKTSILGAAVETVDKVGPCDTTVKILKISDTRKEKRSQITDRAKELLKRMNKYDGIESNELAQGIRETMRTKKAVIYKGLTAGPEVEKSDSIIVVEGRADVLKLLSFGINNAVAMDGSNISEALLNLCNEKKTIVFVDGDRGGDMNVQKLASKTKINYVAKAPDGKEVEELTQKEILQALKRRQEYSKDKKTYGQSNYQNSYSEQRNNYPNYNNHTNNNNYNNNSYNNNRNPRYNRNRNSSNYDRGHYNRDSRDNRGYGRRDDGYRSRERYDPFEATHRVKPRTQETNTQTKAINENQRTQTNTRMPSTQTNMPPVEKDFSKIKGKLKARLYDSKNKKIKDLNVKEIIDGLNRTRKKVDTIILDGIITKKLLETAEKNNVKNIIATKKGTAKSDKINVFTM
jgi:DNA primase